MTKTVAETALTEELSDHLGHDKHDLVAGAGGRATYTVSPISSASSVAEKPASTAVWQAALTYVLWGLVPLFWPLLAAAGAVEILANRLALAPHSGASASGAEVLGPRRRGRVASHSKRVAPVKSLAMSWTI